MHKKTFIAIVVILAATFMLFDTAFAKCGMCKAGAEDKHKEKIVNDTCPVMGGKVENDTLHKVTYKGKKIGLCCAGCVEEFKKNPEKYAAKLKLDKFALYEDSIDEKRAEALEEIKEEASRK